LTERKEAFIRAGGSRRTKSNPEWRDAVRICGSPDREHFVLAHASLIRCIAHRIQSRLPSSIELSDLVNDGVLGLIDAINRFDPARGVIFGAFAEPRIRGAILDSLRARDVAPRSLRRKVREMESASRRAQLRLGRTPDDEELADELGLAEDDIAELRRDRDRTLPASAGPWPMEMSLETFIDPHAPDPFDEASQKQVQGRLAELVLDLPERERSIIGLYYEKELTMKEIGAVFDITESRICQLHTRLVKDLRARLKRLMSVTGQGES
jgi:RNA polymerase sigma factor for flagellar operon FliA